MSLFHKEYSTNLERNGEEKRAKLSDQKIYIMLNI